MAKKTVDYRQVIITQYMDYVLMHSEPPKSVYVFAKENGMKEAEFYAHFSSFDSIEAHIFSLFFENAMQLLSQDLSFQEGSAKHKMLSFYFTFFEILTANRSFVLHILSKESNKLKTLHKLKALKIEFIQFLSGLEFEKMDWKMEKANQFIEKSKEEAAYGQFLLILKFWMSDTSAGFEKTDIFIEKSLQAGFELMNIKPLESIIDLGKFLWKEQSFKKV